jgi:hypothetical protein
VETVGVADFDVIGACETGLGAMATAAVWTPPLQLLWQEQEQEPLPTDCPSRSTTCTGSRSLARSARRSARTDEHTPIDRQCGRSSAPPCWRGTCRGWCERQRRQSSSLRPGTIKSSPSAHPSHLNSNTIPAETRCMPAALVL